MPTVLVVDDDRTVLRLVEKALKDMDVSVFTATSAADGLAAIKAHRPDVLLLDIQLPDSLGLDIAEQVREIDPLLPIAYITVSEDSDLAIEAMKLGAYDFLLKPLDVAVLQNVVERALETRRLMGVPVQLSETEPASEDGDQHDSLVGRSPKMIEVYKEIGRVAAQDVTVLIYGESGTGKELVARALHRRSRRADLPLVVINCAALAETLLESELFGHEKGSFTGAIAAKPGLFEIADGGTLFIDEIGEMPGSLQPKLLRVLEDGSMRRIGSVKERRVDVRIIAATNRDMDAEVKAGRFREDLYYRINVMSLHLPPLRERSGDVAPLVRRFLGPDWQIEPQALSALERYSWPGNIRQLMNAIDRAKILADEKMVRLTDLPRDVAQIAGAPASVVSPAASPSADDASLASLQKAHVLRTLERERGNKARAARALGVSRRSLYRLLERFNIPVGETTASQNGVS